jgi:chromosome partitioning protein
MPAFTPNSLAAFATAFSGSPSPPTLPDRKISIWEITSWILPMAPEHFRRVLSASPSLPQGTAGAEGGTRWFTQADLVALRAHFATGPRKARYQPPRSARAPLVTLTGPLGAMGRSTALLHLATGAALSGYRILVIDGDPAGSLGACLPAPLGHGDETRGDETWGADDTGGAAGAGVLSLIARSAAGHLRRLNEARLDRGEAPQPMDEVLNASLNMEASHVIRPSRWPGLDVMAAPPALMQADLQIAGWRQFLRGWQPGRALAAALDDGDLRQRYDLILCDTPRGLGPLALSLLASADVLLAPLPLHDALPERGAEGGLWRLGAGLDALARSAGQTDAELQQTARALGQTAAPQIWQALTILPTRATADTARTLAGFAAKLGDALLPIPLPEVAALPPAAQLYDLDYRSLGRLAYAPLREACDAAARAAIAALLAVSPRNP